MDFEIYVRCFKREKQLEVWGRSGREHPFSLRRSFQVCALSGSLGPNRREGDLQVPEGVYYVNRFNPQSKFHLSLGLNYPNDLDLFLGDPLFPGRDIFIHGGCQSKGCVALTNEDIEEVFSIASYARRLGQREIRVDLFPFKFEGSWEVARRGDMDQYRDFWQQLAAIQRDFDRTRILRKVTMADGRYGF